jgi:hypothetical protein
MGLENLEESKWYERVLEDYVTNPAKWSARKFRDWQDWQKDMGYYDDRSIITDISDWTGLTGTDAPAFDPELRGTGKKDSLFGVKIPAQWESYDTGSDRGTAADYAKRGYYFTDDTAGGILNTGKKLLWDWPRDILHVGTRGVKEGYNVLQNRYGQPMDMAMKEALAPLGIDWNVRGTDPTQGWGAAGTQLMDTAAIVGGSPSGMNEEAASNIFLEDPKTISPYEPPMVKQDDGTEVINPDLDAWSGYQTWKKLEGNWDHKDDKRISDRVDSYIRNNPSDPSEIMVDFMEYWNSDTGKEMMRQNGIEKIDTDFIRRVFPLYYEDIENSRKWFQKNKYEFEENAQKYGKWASNDYRSKMIKKYGMYPLFPDGIPFEDGTSYSQENALIHDISPFEGINSPFHLAEDSYIEEVKKGNKHIAQPKEFDYGMFDRQEGPGLSDYDKDWFEYHTPEAKDVWSSNQVMAMEFAGLVAAGNPKALQTLKRHPWLMNTLGGRILRETMPGLFHHNRKLFSGQTKLGLPRIPLVNNPKGMWRLYNMVGHTINKPATVINWARPKGGQLAAVLSGSEAGSEFGPR